MNHRRELFFHTAGFAAAMTLTCAAFAITAFPRLLPPLSLSFVLGLGVGQIIVHFVFFLRIDLRKPVREDLLLILFSAFIIVVMVGGTLLIMANLHERMM